MYTAYKDEQHDSSPQVKPNPLNRPLVAGCSIGHKPHLLHDSRWDMAQTKYMLNNVFFPLSH